MLKSFVTYRFLVSPEETQIKDLRSLLQAMLVKAMEIVVKAKVLKTGFTCFFFSFAKCVSEG